MPDYVVENCETGERKIIFTEEDLLAPVNEPCDECPEGYDYNAENDDCEKITSQEATYNGSDMLVAKSATNAAYGWGGANFYTPLSNYASPIIEQFGNSLIDDNGSPVTLVGNVQGIWDNSSGTNGRLNDVGVWGLISANEWSGFSYCVELEESGVYNIGVGADDAVRISINGELLVEMNVNTQYSHTHWHVFEIQMQAGLNVVEVTAQNYSGVAAMGVEIYQADQSVLMSLTDLLDLSAVTVFSTLDRVGSDFDLGEKFGYSCPEGYVLEFCTDTGNPMCTMIEKSEYIDCKYRSYVFDQFPCECYTVIELYEGDGGEYVTIQNIFEDCEQCLASKGQCSFSDRTLAYSIRVKLPDVKPPDRGFKDCCYNNIVMASTTSGRLEYNDFNGFYFKRQMALDSCLFVLVDSSGTEYDLDDNTYGEFKDFGDYVTQPDLTTYRVDWRNVLNTLGEGRYQVKKEMSIAGIPFTEYSNTFNLVEFSNDVADKMVRIDCVMNGKLVHLDVDFKGTDFRTSLRTMGYFGNRDPKYTQDNLVNRSYIAKQISMSQDNEYQYQTGLLPVCITEELYDFILFGNELYANDYNKANHDYGFLRFPVEFKGNKGAKYYPNSRNSRVNLTFSDRKKDKRKVNC